MRRIAAAVVLVLGVGTAVAVTQTPAGAATTAAGTYHALPTAVRVLDTQTGAGGNRKGALAHGALTRVSVVSAQVPSAASAALVSLTAVGATANGYLTAYQDGATRPGVQSLLFPKATTTTVTALVSLKAAKFLIYNGASTGSTQVIADLLGYYDGGDVAPTSAGAFTPMTPQRVAPATTTLAAGATRDIYLRTPARDTTAALTVSVIGAAKAGSVAVYPEGTTPPAISSFYYQAGYGSSGFTFVRVGDDRLATFTNRGSSAIRIAVDITGYANRAAPNLAGALQALEPQRIVSNAAVPAGKVGSYVVSGKAGMAVSNTGTAVVAVTVASTAKAGGFVVGAPGRTTTNLRTGSFNAGQTVGATVLVPTSGGRIEVRNASSGSFSVFVDVLGYLPADAHNAPPTTVARYLDNLTTSSADNQASMNMIGCVDATRGPNLVLLDVGAQSYSGPELSTANPGVAVAEPNPTNPPAPTVKLTYANLNSAIASYLDSFATCAAGKPSAGATIAIGTNNSGNFSDTTNPANPPYLAAARGTDWYTSVVAPLQAHIGSALTIIGASDIENGTPTGPNKDYFDDKFANADAWVTNYLKATGPNGVMINNGSASGCPSSYGANTACNDGWTLSQFASISHRVSSTGVSQIRVLPQIYNKFQASQWANIDRVAGGAIDFAGSLTQNAADANTFTPAQGWISLYRAISSVDATTNIPRAVDITPSD